jgi:hypothetical protein
MKVTQTIIDEVAALIAAGETDPQSMLTTLVESCVLDENFDLYEWPTGEFNYEKDKQAQKIVLAEINKQLKEAGH